jgi:hypothetical protein
MRRAVILFRIQQTRLDQAARAGAAGQPLHNG